MEKVKAVLAAVKENPEVILDEVKAVLAAVKENPEAILKDIDPTTFQSLPIELRWKIWRFSVPTDRVVAITDRRGTVQQNEQRREHRALISARYKVPSSMQVCHEGREEIKKSYVYILGPILGKSLPFNFDFDTLLMDGPDGTATLWSFEQAGRKRSKARDELSMIHTNLKHLIVAGQRLIPRTCNEVQQYTGLETLTLPLNKYWNAPEGSDAFNKRIVERLLLKWTQWKAAGYILPYELVREAFGTDSRGKSVFHTAAKPDWLLGSVPLLHHHLDTIAGDVTDYSKIDWGTVVKYIDEETLFNNLAGRAKVTLSWNDHNDHPASRLREYDQGVGGAYRIPGSLQMHFAGNPYETIAGASTDPLGDPQRTAYRDHFDNLGLFALRTVRSPPVFQPSDTSIGHRASHEDFDQGQDYGPPPPIPARNPRRLQTSVFSRTLMGSTEDRGCSGAGVGTITLNFVTNLPVNPPARPVRGRDSDTLVTNLSVSPPVRPIRGSDSPTLDLGPSAMEGSIVDGSLANFNGLNSHQLPYSPARHDDSTWF